jgi:hypothetical protein
MTLVHRDRRVFAAATAIAFGSSAAAVHAGLTVYHGESGAATWASLAGKYTTVGFTDVQMYEPISFDRYADLGVLLTDPETNFGWLNPGFAMDGHGLSGDCVTEFTFTEPCLAFATRFPGLMQAWIYSGETLLGYAGNLGGGGENFFAGITSTTYFDRIVFKGVGGGMPPFPCDDIFFDDIYFSTVPSPGALPLVGAIALVRRRRRGVD